MKLPQISIATKLYAIFALLATVTVGLAAVAVVNARHHVALTDEFEAAQAGAQNVDRANGLIYAVMMEARGIYLRARQGRGRGAGGKPARRSSTASAPWLRTGRSGCAPTTPRQFTEFSLRAAHFQNFARELAHIATGVSPQAAREWADTDANHAMQKALQRGPRASSPQSMPSAPRASTARSTARSTRPPGSPACWASSPCCWPPPARSSSGSAVARPLATITQRHRAGRRRRRADGRALRRPPRRGRRAWRARSRCSRTPCAAMKS